MLRAAGALPPDDRLALATELLHSVEDRGDLEWSRACAAEIDRRVQDLDAGTVKAIAWSEIRAELKARFASK